eukprot:GFUD01012505.1.p1 GENE.GFUD01012505.1~~GFUD01012505.1.p1  ORF type:complete len:459 (-),score=176.93 GFUD01012505.1:119-1495(-)
MDESKVDPMYMENLEEWILEENKVITYKYLSRSLKVHVNVAKQMLFNFVETKKSSSTPLLGIVYLLSGLMENKDVSKSDDDATEATIQKVLLVKDKDVKDILSKFSKVYSQHIYSVQLAEVVSQTSLYATDLEVFKEDPAGATALTAIKNKAAVPREAVRQPVHIAKKVEVKKEVKPEVKKEVKKSGIEGAFAKTKKASPKKEDNKSSTVEEKPKLGDKNSKPVKKPAANNIANFFAKQAAKPKIEKTEIKSEEKENIVNQRIEEETNSSSKEIIKSPQKAVLKPPVKEIKQSPKKAVKKTPPTKKNSKKSVKEDDSKKRKRIQVMSDSEDEAADEDETDKVENKVEEDEEAPPASKLIESSDDEEIPPTPKQPTRTSKPGRRKVKRQVDKTYVDDQGYMVTKKEYESASETDDEPEPVKEKTPKKVEKIEAPAAKKPKLVAPGGKAQAGIMSFFKKK